VILWILLSCSGEERRDEHEHADETHEDRVEEEHPGELVVREDMLRDLRITTTAAKALAGDERVAVLGELAVSDDRYAEVGVAVPARVRKLIQAPGDTVTVGTELIELESAELGRARAEVAIARARADQARRSSERKTELAGAVSARQIEEAAADLASAEAELRAAEASLAAYGVGTGTEGGAAFTLRSPIAGTVLSREAHRGEVVDASHVLFRIADLSELWLVVHAFERDALRATEGAAVDVTFAALPNRAFRGTVARVGREVDATSRTVPIRIDLANPDGILRPGMSATARIPLGSGEGVVGVPAEAVQRCDAGWCVFVPKDPGHFESRPVGRGRELGGEIEILSGLAAGETVVVHGAFLLRAEAEKQEGGADAHHH
jgi:cobalt-zinc-cadmium efflux system membrane fusion protein